MAEETNRYLQLMQSQEDARPVQAAATLSQAIAVDPDQHAAQKRTASLLGVAPGVVAATPDESQAEARLKQLAQDTAGRPHLQQRYTNDDFARLAHDDSGALGKIEDFIASFTREAMGAGSSRATLLDRAAGGLARGFAGSDDFIAEAADILGLTGIRDQFRGAAKAVRAQADSFDPQIVPGSRDDQLGARVLVGAAESIGQSAPALASGGSLVLAGGSRTLAEVTALAQLFASSAGTATQEGRAKGLSDTQARVLGLTQGVAEAAFEKTPIGRALDAVAASPAFARVLARQVVPEVKGENLTTLVQNFNEWALLPQNRSKSFAEFVLEQPAAMLETTLTTIVAVGAQTGAIQGFSGLVDQTQKEALQRQQAQVDFDNVQRLFGLAASSKLRERDPQQLSDLIQGMADQAEGAPTELFVDARILAGEGGLLNQDQVAELLPSVAPLLEEALASGGDVAVPLGELVANVAGTPFEQQLVEHLRTSPDALSRAEATQAGDLAGEFLQQEAERLIAQAEDAQVTQTSAEAVKAQVLDQLNAANRFTPEVHDAYASLVRDFFTVTGARLGLTAEQMFAAYPLRVAAVNPVDADLQQPAFHGGAVRGIDRFRLDKIGTGEGAQVFGHGLYFASNAEVADFYRKSVTRAQQADGVDPRGQLYSVEVPENDVLLNRDVGLAEQPPAVREALAGLGIGGSTFDVLDRDNQRLRSFDSRDAARAFVRQNNVAGRVAEAPSRLTGAQAYDELSRRLGGDEAASRALGEAGVPGLRYLDANSRDPDQKSKSYNFVIFVEDAVQITDAFFQSGRDGGDTRFADRARELAAAGKTPRRSAVGILTGEVKTPRLKTNEDIAAFFTQRNRRGMEDWPARPAQRRLIEALRADVLHALQDNGNAVGWYDRKVKTAFDLLAGLHPEIATDEQSRFGFTALLAITSNGTAVNQNFEAAEALYRQWKQTGVWPTTASTAGPTAGAMSAGLVKLQALVQQHGWRAVRDFMTTDQSVADIEAFSGVKIASELRDEKVYGAVFLGSKIGAFFNNLYGNFTPVTMDRWFMRSINRTRGSMLALPATFNEHLAALPGELVDAAEFGADTAAVRAEVAAFLAAPSTDAIVARQALPATMAYAKARNNVFARGGYRDRTRANIRAKNLAEALALDQQTPANGGERSLLRKVMRELQTGLQADGIDITMADLQAVLWFSEKDLFARLKGQNAQGDFFGATKEAEDYETAARRVVQLRGGRRGDEVRSEGPSPAGRGGAAGGPERQFAADLAVAATATGELLQTDPGRLRDPGGVRGSPDGVGVAPGADAVDDQPLDGLPAVVRVDGRDVTFGPHAPAREAARRYMERAGLPYAPPTRYVKVDRARAERIAQTFDAMPHAPRDARTKAAYDALVRETLAQWQVIKETGLQVEFIEGPDPYGNPRNAILDVVENNHLWVFPTEDGFGEALLNVGLNVKDGRTIDEAAVRGALAEAGAVVLGTTLLPGVDEPTLVVRLAQALQPEVANRVSAALSQEAIAQIANNQGALFGPQAFKWQPFNPDFFLMPDGQTAAGTNALDRNPLLEVVPGETISGRQVRVNDIFRIVHDYFGHVKEGTGFRADGEENAWRAHWAMFSPLARAALTTETRGQNSWVNFGPHALANATANGANTQFAPQKIGLLPDWVVNEGATDTDAETGTLNQSPVSPTVGVHFSRQPRTSLLGAYYGTGLKGAEAERLRVADDARLRDRVYFYVDEGQGVRPEAGVGGFAHEVQLPPLYDAKADPLKLWKGSDLNATETRILDAGFSGYFVRDAFNGQGAAVVIGPASHGMAAKQIANPTTQRAPTIAPGPFKRALLSDELERIDIARIQAAAPSAKLRSGTFVVDPAELPAARAAARQQGIDLPDPLAQGPRGSFSPSQLTITLLEKADLSTFLHETAHFFLEVLGDVASRADAPVEVRQDVARVLDWFGIKAGENKTVLETWNAMSLDEQRPFHEQFAVGFEQYLFEGKAPNQELQPLFARFRSWMINVYRSLQDFLANNSAKLTPSVRGVFDRLLASEQTIAEAEQARAYAPLFKDAAAAGMTPAEWQAYQAIGQKATDDAITKLGKRSLADMRFTAKAHARALREAQRDVADKRKAVEDEVRTEVLNTPEELARGYLAELRKKAAAESKTHKAARKAWSERFDAAKQAAAEQVKTEDAFKTGAERKLEVSRRMLQWESENPAPQPEISAQDMDVVADLFGFSSGDELARVLAATSPADELIEARTDQRLLERFGDITSTAALQRAADEAVHNEARGRFIATGLAALLNASKQSEKQPGGKRSVNVITQAAKQFAQGLVARQKVRDVRPAQHLAAEARAGKKALAAMAGGDTQLAVAAQRDQLLNHHAARFAREAVTEVEKRVRWLRSFSDNTTLPPEYRDQIDKLLERFDLRRVPLKEIDKRASLLEWVESQRAIGVEPELPPGLLNEAQRKNYRDVTVEEFRGLVDAVKQIEHLGRLKGRLLTARDQRDFEATRDAITQSIVEHAGTRSADTRTPTTNLGRALQGLRNFGAAHIKAATLARVLDGGQDGGPVWETFVRSANERADQETTQRAEATAALTRILAPVFDAGKLGGKGVYFPSLKRSFNRESLLAIALNTGNDGNLQRLLGGEGWTMEQLQPALDSLSAADWGVVQQVWDYFETWRPAIGAKSVRVYGVEPQWIEPKPREQTLPDGSQITLRGGYYPIKFDPAASVRAEEFADAEGARRQLQGALGAATTRRSFTKTRAEEVVGRPLLYTLSGLYTGVNDVIHDLAWHEWLIDTNRLLRSQSIDGAIRTHYGPAVVRQFKTWRDAIAEGDGRATEALDQALGRLRQGVSVAGLGFNLTSALMQPLGFTQSIVRVGASWVGRGLVQYLGNPARATEEVHQQSEFMRNRSRTRFRELNELRNQVQGQSTTSLIVSRGAFYMLLQVQQMVDTPTWLGARDKALAAGNDEARAIALADQAVIDSQGSGQLSDLSAIERGGPAQKLFTVFYTFMNTSLNLGVASKMTPGSRARFAVDMALLYAVPAVLGDLLKSALTPGDDGDDWEELGRKLIGSQISYLMGLMVVTREFSEAARTVAGVTEYPRDYTGPAGVRVVADAGKLARQAQQGEFDDAFRKALINLAGSLFGLPSAQANRTITGAQALAEGKTSNPAALAFGFEEEK